MQHSAGTTVQGIASRFNEGQCMSVQDIVRCCRRERTVQNSTGTTVQDITGRFNEGQCRPVQDYAGESRTVRDIAGQAGLCRTCAVQDSGRHCRMVLKGQ